MARWRRICALDELPAGARRVVELNDWEEALVLNLDGRLYAISNICPHEGAALQRGRVEGTVLYCPLHRWGFDLTTGAYLDDASICARRYEVRVCNQTLFLGCPEARAAE